MDTALIPAASPGSSLARDSSSVLSVDAPAKGNVCWRRPGTLAFVGAVLLVVGTATLLVAPFAVTAGRGGGVQSAAPAPAAAASQPAPDLPATDASSSEWQEECGAHLADRRAYLAAALAAEEAAFGQPVANLSRAGGAAAVQAALDAAPRLPAVPLLFWVLHSPVHSYSPRFPSAVAGQVAVLNAAFAKSGIQFTLAGLVPVAASDEAVAGCAWGGQPGSDAGSLVSRLVSEPGTTINVVVCQPGGVHGVTNVLGDSSSGSSSDDSSGGDSGGSEEGGVQHAGDLILLARSALFLSRTSLVHQVGHFFGLAHPFPEKEGCKEDADGVHDTPRQFAPHVGCDLDAGMNVCQGEDGALPVYNYMDFTNDTCRRQFTLGQMARMHAMLSALRPQLYTAAAAGYRATPLPLARAAQSGLPPLGAIQGQQAAAAAAATAAAAGSAGSGSSAASSSSSSSGGSGSEFELGEQLQRLGDSSGQAALAASGQLATGPHQCSCLGPDAQGRLLWVGELGGGAYWVDAVRILWRAAPAAAGLGQGGVGGKEAGGDMAEQQQVAGCAGASGDGGGLLCSKVQLPELVVEVRVGLSPDPRLNARCTPAPATLLQQPLQHVECQAPLLGRFVSLEVLNSSLGLAGPPPCFCAIQPLSYLSSPQPALDAPAATVPGSVLQPSQWWQVRQSSTAQAAAASALAAALPSMQGQASTAGEAGAAVGSGCSATAVEREPWWALDAGLDSLALRGLRFSTPNACPAAAASAAALAGEPACSQGGACASEGSGCSRADGGTAAEQTLGCTSLPGSNLTVLVGASVEGLLSGGAAAGSVCAAGVAVLPGQLVEVDCGRLLHGTAVLLKAQLPAPAALQLCGLELLGAVELSLGEALQAQHRQLPPEAAPPSLRPFLALPVDGNPASCLEGPDQGNSSWSLPLQGLPQALALSLVAAGGNVTARLLDGAGPPIWESQLAGLPAQEAYVEMDPTSPAAWLTVQGFTSLCEVRLFATPAAPATAYPLRPPSPALGSTASGDSNSAAVAALGSRRSGWAAVSAAGRDAGAAADGNYRTCFAGQPGRGESWVLLQLGGSYRLDSVSLVSGHRQRNLTLHTLPPGAAAGFLRSAGLPQQAPSVGETAAAGVAAPSATQAPALALPAALRLAGAQLCAAGVAVGRWLEMRVECGEGWGSPVAEALLVVAGDAVQGSNELNLCEVGLVGAAAPAVR